MCTCKKNNKMYRSPQIVWFISVMNMLQFDLRKYKNKMSHLFLFTPVDMRGFFFTRIIFDTRNCIQNLKQNSCLSMQIKTCYNNITFFFFTWQQITPLSFINTLTCNNAHKTRSLHWQKNLVQCLTMRSINEKSSQIKYWKN